MIISHDQSLPMVDPRCIYVRVCCLSHWRHFVGNLITIRWPEPRSETRASTSTVAIRHKSSIPIPFQTGQKLQEARNRDFRSRIDTYRLRPLVRLLFSLLLYDRCDGCFVEDSREKVDRTLRALAYRERPTEFLSLVQPADDSATGWTSGKL